jgi:hypothetical protein
VLRKVCSVCLNSFNDAVPRSDHGQHLSQSRSTSFNNVEYFPSTLFLWTGRLLWPGGASRSGKSHRSPTCQLVHFSFFYLHSRSLRPRGLRRGRSAERLLGSWVRIPPGAWMFVSCECLCCQVEISETDRSLIQRSPTDCGVCLNAIKWQWKQPRHLLWVGRRGKDCERKLFAECIHFVIPLIFIRFIMHKLRGDSGGSVNILVGDVIGYGEVKSSYEHVPNAECLSRYNFLNLQS